MKEHDASANQALAKIGTILKQKREESSYTLEQVAEITRIATATLRNIEEGIVEQPTAPVFIKGFIRNYAKLLGLDSREIMEELNKTFEPERTETDYPEDTSFVDEKTFPILPVALILIVLLALVGGSLFYFTWFPQIMEPKAPEDAIESVATPTEEKGSVKKEIPKEAKTEPPVVAKTTPTPGPPPPSEEKVEPPPVVKKVEPEVARISPLTLVLQGKEEGWVRLKIDAKPPFDLRLQKNKKYEWPAENQYELVMTTGSMAGVYLNGEEIEIPSSQRRQLYQIRLNKFSLTKINN